MRPTGKMTPALVDRDVFVDFFFPPRLDIVLRLLHCRGLRRKQPGSIKKADFKVSEPSNKLQTQIKITDLEKRTAQTWSGSRKPIPLYLKFKQQQTINLVVFISLSENICLALIKADITVKWQKDKTQCFHSLQDARYSCCYVCFAGVTWLYPCQHR